LKANPVNYVVLIVIVKTIKIMIEIMEVDQSKSVIDHRLSLKFPKLIVAMSHQLKPLYVTLNFNGLAALRFLVDNNGAILDIMPLTLIKKDWSKHSRYVSF
jgi:hypothetical protein